MKNIRSCVGEASDIDWRAGNLPLIANNSTSILINDSSLSPATLRHLRFRLRLPREWLSRSKSYVTRIDSGIREARERDLSLHGRSASSSFVLQRLDHVDQIRGARYSRQRRDLADVRYALPLPLSDCIHADADVPIFRFADFATGSTSASASIKETERGRQESKRKSRRRTKKERRGWIDWRRDGL